MTDAEMKIKMDMKTEKEMKTNEKAVFDSPVIEIVDVVLEDIITTSADFTGDDDPIDG